MTELESIRDRLRAFAKARNWDQFHSPKNLAMALSVEASELVECFQWLTETESHNLDQQQKAAIADEIADVQLYLIRLADKTNINITDAIEQKLIKNEEKYPAEKVKGSAQKYNMYE